MKRRNIFYTSSIIILCTILMFLFVMIVLADPSFAFYKNIQLLNEPSQFLSTFQSTVTNPERVLGLNIHYYDPKKQIRHASILPGGQLFYGWDSKKKKYFFMSQENDSGNGVEDPMNFGIFSNSGLWERIFKEKAYDIKKDQKGGAWIVTIPAAKIRDALLEDQKKVITVFNDLYESHECYQGLIANKKVKDITSDAGLTGDLIFEIDSKTKLIRSIEIPDLQTFEVQYSGTICDKPDEKVTGFYDIASNESVKYIVDEIEENKAVRKKSNFWDELIFAFGHVEL